MVGTVWRLWTAVLPIFFDEFGFVEEGLGNEILEGALVEEGAEGVVVGLAQAAIEAVEPVDDGF